MLRLIAALLALILAAVPASAEQRGPLVLAASSMQEVLTAAADAWAAQGHARPVLSFAATPALAWQVQAGAKADLFISADAAWMDYLVAHKSIRPGSRAILAGNSLVLIAPASSRVQLTIAPRFPLATALGKGRLAMADPGGVPAGCYGKQALTRLGAWPAVSGKIAAAENVRAALALVRRGEAPLGIVYATDALATPGVRVVDRFPSTSHAPIRYHVATLAVSRRGDAELFRRFLLSAEGKAIFRRFGFGTR